MHRVGLSVSAELLVIVMTLAFSYCWFGDRKDIQTLKNLAPSVSERSLGDLWDPD